MPDLNEIVLHELNGAIQAVVKEKLGAYNSPLSKMVDDVVINHRSEITGLLKDALDEALDNNIFCDEIKGAFTHTLARSLMNDFKGEIEKQANLMRQNPEFRARVVLAIENIVKELSTVRSST